MAVAVGEMMFSRIHDELCFSSHTHTDMHTTTSSSAQGKQERKRGRERERERIKASEWDGFSEMNSAGGYCFNLCPKCCAQGPPCLF